MLHRAHWLLLSTLLLVVAVPRPLLALHDGDQVHFGNSIVVEEGEEAGDLVCVGCSIRMAGSCGDIVAVGGSIMVDGTVHGDAVAVGGGLRLGENAAVTGDVVTVGGRLMRHPSAIVKGSVSSQSGVFILLGLVLVPLVPVILFVALIVWLFSRKRSPAPVRR